MRRVQITDSLFKMIICVSWNLLELEYQLLWMQLGRYFFFPGLFLEGKLISKGEAELVQAALCCCVLMIVCTFLQGFGKLGLKLETLTKSLYWRVTSFSAVFSISRFRFPKLGAVGRTPQNHLSVSSSVADFQLLLPQKLEKHRNFSCLSKPSGSTAGRQEVTAGHKQSCSGHLTSILWRKTKNKEPSKLWKEIWKKKILTWWQMNSGAASKDEKQP